MPYCIKPASWLRVIGTDRPHLAKVQDAKMDDAETDRNKRFLPYHIDLDEKVGRKPNQKNRPAAWFPSSRRQRARPNVFLRTFAPCAGF